jgi:hypothetical protein
MKISEINLSHVPVIGVTRRETRATAQAILTRALFRRLGVSGLRVTTYTNVSGAGVEIKLPRDATRDDETMVWSVIKLAFRQESLSAPERFNWSVVLRPSPGQAQPAAEVVLEPRGKYRVELEVDTALSESDMLDTIAERLPARIIGGRMVISTSKRIS